MKLVSFQIGDDIRLGALWQERVIDLNLSYTAYLTTKGHSSPASVSLSEMPPRMIPFLELGKDAIERAKKLLEVIDSGGIFGQEDFGKFSYPKDAVQLLAPVPYPGKIIVVGLNYPAHVSESQVDIPKLPWTFAKPSSVIIGPEHPIGRPPLTKHLDGEVELGVIIGERGKYIQKEDALEHVAGYNIFNDVSARNIQFEGQVGLRCFFLGKSFQDSAVLGPALVTADELTEPYNLSMAMYYNDRLIRKGNTKHYIFKVEELIAFYSRFLTLEPGDVIACGCPPAIVKKKHHIFYDKDYRFLEPGDRCICEIEGLGVLENPIIDAKESKNDPI